MAMIRVELTEIIYPLAAAVELPNPQISSGIDYLLDGDGDQVLDGDGQPIWGWVN
ncbi:MAG: hypothetical protein L3J57_01600 [Desulfuromusa sp.]|nr:hypothetical protein [Desulfuromusa sp.]